MTRLLRSTAFAANSFCRHGLLVSVVMLLAASSDVRAQNAQSEANDMFRSLDRNNDNRLSQADVDAGANGQMLDQIRRMAGKGTNDSISRDEFQTVFDRHRSGNSNPPPRNNPPMAPNRDSARPAPQGLSESLLQVLDGDHDGLVSRDEWTRFGRMWSQLDRDGDMQLSTQELAVLERAGDAPSDAAGRPQRSLGNDTSDRANPTGRLMPTRPAAGRQDDTLVGTWRGWVVHGTGDVPNTGEMEVELVINSQTIVARELNTNRARGGLGSGTYSLNGDGAGTLDADQTEGPEAGRHFRGVYELNGDTLRWCVTGRNRERPTTMATDRGNYLLILNRQK